MDCPYLALFGLGNSFIFIKKMLRNWFEKLYNERSCWYLLEVKTVLKDVAFDERGTERCRELLNFHIIISVYTYIFELDGGIFWKVERKLYNLKILFELS